MFITKLNTVFLYDPQITFLGIYPVDLLDLYPQKTLHMNVYISFIHKYPNMEGTKILISE